MATVLGIDPGTHRMGWGIIDGTPSKSRIIDCGCLEFSPKSTSQEYLVGIHAFLQSLLSKYQINYAGIEKLFAQHNKKSVISVAEARGVILMSFAEAKVSYKEYSPNTIKSAVAGSGSAGKIEVERMVRLLLNLSNTKLLDDTTDALAIALTAQTEGL